MLRTLGSAALDKAQRRLALLKSIDAQLDLGHQLSIETYTDLIEMTRATLETHNTLVSRLSESRQTVARMDKALSAFSERMLSGVATRYGKDSIEYSKAGGSNRRRSKSSASPDTPNAAASAPPATRTTAANGSTNGNGKTSAVQ